MKSSTSLDCRWRQRWLAGYGPSLEPGGAFVRGNSGKLGRYPTAGTEVGRPVRAYRRVLESGDGRAVAEPSHSAFITSTERISMSRAGPGGIIQCPPGWAKCIPDAWKTGRNDFGEWWLDSFRDLSIHHRTSARRYDSVGNLSSDNNPSCWPRFSSFELRAFTRKSAEREINTQS